MTHLSGRILINRPVTEVFAFISNYQNDWKWRTRHLEVQALSDEKEVELVSTRSLFSLFPQKQSTHYQILDQILNQCLISRIDLGKISVIDERHVKDTKENSTEFEYTIRLGLRGVAKIFQPMLLRDLSRDFNRDLTWLKELMELLQTSTVT